MRRVYALAVASAAAGLLIGTAPSPQAAPLAGLAAPETAIGIVEKTGMYRRYYRRAVPSEQFDGTVVGEAGPPAVVVVRPANCGQYKYWNGTTCADARYTDPYLGPKD